MSRPSDATVREMLALMARGLAGEVVLTDREQRIVLGTLQQALTPREVWPAKEVAECLGKRVSNLRTVKGLPEPAWVFDRPTTLYPEKKMNLYWRDEIEALAERKRTEKEGG